MENSILATISLLNVLVGFATGLAFANLFRIAETYKLQYALENAKTVKFSQDLYVDELLEQIEHLEERNEELQDHVNRAVEVLTSSLTTLPAPDRDSEGKLDRQTQCFEEEIEFTLHSKTD